MLSDSSGTISKCVKVWNFFIKKIIMFCFNKENVRQWFSYVSWFLIFSGQNKFIPKSQKALLISPYSIRKWQPALIRSMYYKCLIFTKYRINQLLYFEIEKTGSWVQLKRKQYSLKEKVDIIQWNDAIKTNKILVK